MSARRRLWPDPFQSIGADPRYCWARGVDSVGNLELGLYPPPVTDRVYFFEYYRRAVHPVAGSDAIEAITGLPVKFHPILVARAKDYAFEHERENGDVRSRAELMYIEGLSRMAKLLPPGGASRQVSNGREHRHGHYYDNPDISALSGLPFEG